MSQNDTTLAVEPSSSRAHHETLNPAQHVAPGGHAQPFISASALAAAEAGIAKFAHDRVDSIHHLEALHHHAPLYRIDLNLAAAHRLSQESWRVLNRLAHAEAEEAAQIIKSQPLVARELALLLIASGGAAMLAHWHAERERGARAVTYRPLPDPPPDDEEVGVSLTHPERVTGVQRSPRR